MAESEKLYSWRRASTGRRRPAFHAGASPASTQMISALAQMTTVNLDFLRHYRPLTNVVSRPTAGTGTGYSLTGHHEIMIPLLAALLIESS